MFWKLCKHELKCSYRSFLILYAILLVASICFSPNFSGTLGSIWSIIYITVIAAVFIMSFVVMIRNYHISMFERNGYLTHTLPISTTQLLAVKIFGGMFWLIASSLVFLLGLFLLALRMMNFDFQYLMNSMKEVMAIISNGDFLLYMFYLLIAFLETISLIYFAMNLVHSGIIYRYRAVAVILIVILIDYVMQEALHLVMSPFSSMISVNALLEFDYFYHVRLDYTALLLSIVKSLVLFGLYFFGSHYLLERRLEVE